MSRSPYTCNSACQALPSSLSNQNWSQPLQAWYACEIGLTITWSKWLTSSVAWQAYLIVYRALERKMWKISNIINLSFSCFSLTTISKCVSPIFFFLYLSTNKIESKNSFCWESFIQTFPSFIFTVSCFTFVDKHLIELTTEPEVTIPTIKKFHFNDSLVESEEDISFQWFPV